MLQTILEVMQKAGQCDRCEVIHEGICISNIDQAVAGPASLKHQLALLMCNVFTYKQGMHSWLQACAVYCTCAGYMPLLQCTMPHTAISTEHHKDVLLPSCAAAQAVADNILPQAGASIVPPSRHMPHPKRIDLL